MTKHTAQLITLALDGDDTVTKNERDGILAIVNGMHQDIHGLVTRQELARLARKSVKWVDRFSRDNPSIFVRVKKKGATRALGFTRESVVRFLSGTK